MSLDVVQGGLPSAAVVVLIAAALGALLTSVAVWWTRRRGILDHPNERSSHEQPTPRGGGVSIVTLTLIGEAIAWRAGLLPNRTAAALLLGGALVAGIGAWDDLRNISVRARLPVQFIAAATTVILLARPATPWADIVIGVVAVLGIVWMTNLYNFMDGIDGIAGAQGVAAGLGAAAVLWTAGSPGLALVALTIAGACAGFLTRNWSPARIFMGDVGSSFLGFTFGALTWAAVRTHGLVGYCVLVPLLPFIVDATATLLRRGSRGAAVTEAHREHLYQQAVIGGLPHAAVAGAYGVVAALLAVAAAVGARLSAGDALLTGAGALVAVSMAYAAATVMLGRRKATPSAQR